MTKNKDKPSWQKLLEYITKREILLAILVSVAVVATALFLGWYNNKVVLVNPDTAAHYTLEPHNHLSFIANWDGPDYLKISMSGYGDVGNTNFFPLYPLLVHFVNMFINSALYSALIISWASLVGAVYFFLKIVKKLFKVDDNLEALKAVLLFVLFPTAVFLVAPYTEALFAFLSLGAIYFLLKKKYVPSAIFALFAGATHITGIFMLLLLFLMLIEQRVKISKIILYMIVSSLGLISYMIYLYKTFKAPFAFITAQKSHGWIQSGYISHIQSTFSIINIVFIVLLLASVIYWWKRKKSFSIYSLSFLLIPIVGGQFGGFDRYTLMAFPVQFMLFESLRNKHLIYSMALAAFAILWTYTLFQYTGGYTGS